MPNGLRFQSVTTPTKPAHNRYPETPIADLIEAERKARGWSVEQASEVIGKEPTSWYKKVQGITPFKVDEIGRLAEAWDKSDGWPFLQIQVKGRRA